MNRSFPDCWRVFNIGCTIDVWAIREQRLSLKVSAMRDPDWGRGDWHLTWKSDIWGTKALNGSWEVFLGFGRAYLGGEKKTQSRNPQKSCRDPWLAPQPAAKVDSVKDRDGWYGLMCVSKRIWFYNICLTYKGLLKDRQGVSARVWGWLQTSIVPYVSCSLILSCNMTRKW